MTGRTGSRVATAVVIAVLLAGCGGGGGVSKADFVKNADRICKRHFAVISAAAAKVLAGGRLPDPRAFGELALGTIVPQYRAQIGELRRVGAPGALKAPYAAWLKDSDAVRARVAADPKLITNPASFTPVNRQADRLGLSRECHVGPG